MEKFSTLKTDLLELWIKKELKEIGSENPGFDKEPSKDNIEFLKQFAAGYFPVERKELEFEFMLN